MNSFITKRFFESIETKQATLQACLPQIEQAIQCLSDTLTRGNKVLICGNGGSAADAQHFAAELIMRYETNRKSLPAIALSTDSSILTAISNDLSFETIFARQIEGLGQAGDLLIALSTSGNSPNIIKAIKTAQQNKLSIITLTGGDGGAMRSLLRDNDTEITVASPVTGRIQETHILIIHCLTLYGKSYGEVKFVQARR